MKAQIKIINDDGSDFIYGEWTVMSIEITQDMPPTIEGVAGSWAALSDVPATTPPVFDLVVSCGDAEAKP